MAIEYVVYCDGCGALIASSRLSPRAARADGCLNAGANHGQGIDRCKACRLAAARVDLAHAADRAHSVRHSISTGTAR
jgi:hypothetical protein